ncbi:hypothetical protein AMTR_s00046p00066610 [Amborella trichopoda]|uniref:BHLH domain-containing protein n=1 Tax=Amborella trichopoda TaxID=13333 RepID=U5D6S1_AMBTC|nr:hypothetical protein AMTR_s00046p00066610 [Amborella trichopoda]
MPFSPSSSSAPSSFSSSFPSQNSDFALAMAAGRAAGFIPQANWEAFHHLKTFQPHPSPFLASSEFSGDNKTLHEQPLRPEFPVLGDFARRNLPLVSSSVGDETAEGTERGVCGTSGLSEAGVSGRQSSIGDQSSPRRDSEPCKKKKAHNDNDLDDLDCESEEGQEPSEEMSKPAPSRSSTKRSRAAEVHNLSEKRRRSRINEKMKALQNLIPNSNKTDKASMLDEAIEYLKQLQLQVQMLSMKSGINLAPMCMPGQLQSMQLPQICMGFTTENGTLPITMGMGLLPVNQQDSSSQPSFDLPNISPPSSSLQSLVMPNIPNVIPNSGGCAETSSFGLDSSQGLVRPYQLSSPAEDIYRADILPQQQVDMIQSVRSTAENQTKTVASSLSMDGQVTVLERANYLEAFMCVGDKVRPGLPKDVNSQSMVQRLHCSKIERGISNTEPSK